MVDMPENPTKPINIYILIDLVEKPKSPIQAIFEFENKELLQFPKLLLNLEIYVEMYLEFKI